MFWIAGHELKILSVSQQHWQGKGKRIMIEETIQLKNL